MKEKVEAKSKSKIRVDRMVVVKDVPMSPPEDKEWYPAKFVEAELGDGKFGPYVKLKFELLAGERADGTDAKGMPVTLIANAELSPSSKLMRFYVQINGGVEPDIDDEIDFTAFYGSKFDVFVETEEKGDVVRYSITKIEAYQHKNKKKKLRSKVSGVKKTTGVKKVKKVKKIG